MDAAISFGCEANDEAKFAVYIIQQEKFCLHMRFRDLYYNSLKKL